MKRALLVMVAGCYASVHYHSVGWGYWGYGWYAGHAGGNFSTSYGSTGIVWNAPQPPPGQSDPPEVMRNDEPVEGSDGTFGWRRNGNADVEIHRVSEQLARACQVGKYGYDETQATCGNVPVYVRRDDVHVYLLCAAGVDRKACETTWVSILR